MFGNLSWAFAILLVATSFGTALIALFAASFLLPGKKVTWGGINGEPGTMTFLFEGEELVDATKEAHTLLTTGPESLAPWPRMLALLTRSFPTIGAEAARLAQGGTLELISVDGAGRLEAEWCKGVARFTLHEGEARNSVADYDSFSIIAMAEELEVLRSVVDDAPLLAWREDKEGRVSWANGAYVDLLQRMRPEEPTLPWPLPRVFENQFFGTEPNAEPRRISVTIPFIDQEIWYDCTAHSFGGEALVFAMPADRLVQAERSRKEFLQTLTRTFADLPIGLAVFDSGRQLTLFNPALTDLSALEPSFLIGRPTLVAFLDRLREARRMPEPKDYKSWRHHIADLESAAEAGIHQEVWSLPTGQTYRVTGQPHPDGAIALLFEDISAEISLTRRFRAELEMGQAVVDSLEEAIAVFSHTGSLVQSNRAYQAMWDCDRGDSLIDITAEDAVRDWRNLHPNAELWARALRYISQIGERDPWEQQIEIEGKPVHCRFTPITGGATLVGFTKIAAIETPSQIPPPAKRQQYISA